MNAIELLLRNEAATVVLEMIRVSGMIIVAPLAWTNAPNRVKIVLIILLTFVAHGEIGSVPISEAPVEQLVFAAGTELVLGVAIGLVPRLAITAVEIAGEEIAPMAGIGVAQMFDPQSHQSQNVVTTVLRNFALLVATLIGLHRVVLAAVIQSFRAVPAGSASGLDGLTPIFIELSGNAINTGVRLAIPLIAILLVTQVALAFVSRAAPAMQIFSIGFAVTLSIGGVLLYLLLPDLGGGFTAELSHVRERIETILLAVAGGS